MIEKDAFGFFVTLGLMTLVVYLTRIAGYWLIGRLVIGRGCGACSMRCPAQSSPRRWRRSGSGRPSARLALGATVLVMIAVRKDFFAVLAGVAVAALVRAAGI